MKITSLINYFTKNYTYYTFKEEEHAIVLLKKLDDNKICYNSQVYDKNFFEYYKLEAFVQKIYDARDLELKNWFKQYYIDMKKQGQRHEVLNPNPWESLHWHFLTLEQYNKLIECYKYEFYYPFKYDLLDINREIPYYTKISSLFNEWFYVVGWKSIKPVFPTFKIMGSHAHYEDEPRTIEKKEELVFRLEYDAFEEGTRFVFDPEEYPEYDEEKKFNEFNVNSKTNTYHMRYKAYNEIYWKDYPEIKKFRTDFIHKFTEKEIQLNYENMINKEKTAKEKWDYVMRDGMYVDALEEFFESIRTLKLNMEYVYYKDTTWFYEEHEIAYTDLGKIIEREIEEILTNPRNLLLMPLLDAYFEMYRPKAWYTGDNTFDEVKNLNGKHYFDYLYIFDYTYERYSMCHKNEDIIFDYIDIEDDDYDEDFEDEYEIFNIALYMFIWLCGVSVYFYCHCMYINYHDNMFNVLPEYLNTVTNYAMSKPKMYYGMELRVPRTYYGKRKRYYKPRTIHYRFNPHQKPTNYFYDSTYYLNIRDIKRTRKCNPLTIALWKPGIFDYLGYKFEDQDLTIYKFDEKLRMFGIKYGIYKIRIPWVEPALPDEHQLIWPKIKNLAWNIGMAILHAVVYVLLLIRNYIYAPYIRPHLLEILHDLYPNNPKYWNEERWEQYKLHREEQARLK